MSGSVTTHVVKERATAAGYRAATLSSHFLRVRVVTKAIRAGTSHSQITAHITRQDPRP